MKPCRTTLCALLAACCLSTGWPSSSRAANSRNYSSLRLAPSPVAPKDETWRPISEAERAQKAPIVEKDADAEYQLFEVKVDDTDDTDLSLRYYIRIKIFTERGRENFSKIDITGSPNSKLKDVAARVTKADGTVVDLGPADIFERTIVKVGSAKIKARSFAVPGIEPGVIVEYKYKETFENASAGRPLDFQKEIPVQVMTYLIRPNERSGVIQYERHNVPESVGFSEDKDKYKRITMNNVPAFHEEPQMPPLREIRPWMSVRYGVLSIFSDEFYWATQSKALEEVTRDLMKPNDEVKRLAAQLTAGAATSEDKVSKLYNYCQTQIKNLAYDTSMSADEKSKLKSSKSPGDTLKRQYGWPQDIDLLFASLVRSSGMSAQVAWVGDRSERFFNRSMKNINLLDPANIAVKVDNNWKFYNPGARFVPYGMLAWQEEGQEALIPDKENLIWIKTPTSEPERTREKRTGKFKLLEDGTLEGEVRIEYTGQYSYFRKRNNYDDSANQQEETLKEEMKERLSTAELSDIKLENVSDPLNPFAYTFKIQVPGYAQKTGKRLFLKPGFFEHGNGAKFTAAERKYDVYFHYPWSEEEEFTIELPAGYVLDGAERPAPITPQMTQGICGLTIGISISSDKRTLNYKRSFFFGAKGITMFPKENYAALKQLFDLIHTADDHSIALIQK